MKKPMEKIKTLCRGRGCCPEFNIDFSVGNRDINNCQYVLIDDYDNKLIFIKEDFQGIYAEINKYLKEYDYYDITPDDEQEDILFTLKNTDIKMKPFQLKMLRDTMENVESQWIKS